MHILEYTKLSNIALKIGDFKERKEGRKRNIVILFIKKTCLKKKLEESKKFKRTL